MSQILRYKTGSIVPNVLMTDMTVREVAEYLKVKDRTIYRLVSSGKMPGFKVGGSWRSRKSEIDQWTAANAVGPVEPGKRVEMKQ